MLHLRGLLKNAFEWWWGDDNEGPWGAASWPVVRMATSQGPLETPGPAARA